MNTRHTNTTPIAILLFCMLAAYGRGATAQADSHSLESRLQNMQRLLNESSGAEQVIDSGDTTARKMREQALELYREASEQHAAGAVTEAGRLLDSSARLMFEAIKAATPPSEQTSKKKVDYGKRRESVTALQEAFDRIAEETGDTDDRDKIDRQLATIIGQADQLLESGDTEAAQVELDKAYHLLKVSIEAKRSGQTLVRSLDFKSKEEEYLYEVDRNDTHQILIGLLTNDRDKSDIVLKEMNRFIEEARQLRRLADNYGDAGEFAAAIDLLEQSTRQLVRAIRSTGIYIPG